MARPRKESAPRVDVNAAARDQLEKQRQEPHYWIEFQRTEGDPVDTVYIGAAGVSYHVKKGERVPLPESALNAVANAVIQTREPFVENGKRYIRNIKYQRFPYTVYGPATPEEAAAWKREQAAKVHAREGVELVEAESGVEELPQENAL